MVGMHFLGVEKLHFFTKLEKKQEALVRTSLQRFLYAAFVGLFLCLESYFNFLIHTSKIQIIVL